MHKHSLLIVEDDPNLRLTIGQLLDPYFHTVQTCGRVASAYLLLERKQYDIALIDRVLPDGSGLELVSHLHQTALQTKVVLMSCLGDARQRTQGLERGALDYLAKPIFSAELTLKIKQYLHLYCQQNQEEITTRAGSLHSGTGTFVTEAGTVHLRKKEVQLLTCLLHHRPHIVTKRTLIQSVWGHDSPPLLSTLDVYVRRIRIRLAKTGCTIKTVRGFGYVFADIAET